MLSHKLKYIKTKAGIIVAFCDLMTHDQFKHLEPVSAGFMSINSVMVKHGDRSYPKTDCSCYGESISLGLKSDEEVDSALARRQILGHPPF